MSKQLACIFTALALIHLAQTYHFSISYQLYDKLSIIFLNLYLNKILIFKAAEKHTLFSVSPLFMRPSFSLSLRYSICLFHFVNECIEYAVKCHLKGSAWLSPSKKQFRRLRELKRGS